MSLGVITPSAIAEPNPEAAQAKLEETLIYGVKRPQSRGDIAGAVSLIDQTLLAATYPRTVVDISALVPGLYAQENGSRNPTPVVMRGINFDAISSNDLGGDSGTVATYVDDIPLQGYYTPPQFMLKDLDRVEVFRGPQGALYGASSLSGVIRYETAKPVMNEISVQLHTRISQTDESDDLSHDSDVIANIPVVDDKLAVRLLLSYSDDAGFIDNDFLVTGAEQDINDEEVKAGRLSVLFRPVERAEFNLMVQSQETEIGGRQADNPSIAGKDYALSSSYLEPVEGELDTVNIRFSYNFDDYAVELAANTYRYEQKQIDDISSLLIDIYGPPYKGYKDSEVDVDQNSFEARLFSKLDGPLNGIVGVFYSEVDLSASGVEYVTEHPIFVEADYSTGQEQTLEDLAIYAEATWDITDQFSLIAGARYFDYEDEAVSCSEAVYASLPEECYGESVADSEANFKVAALFAVNDHLSLYANLSEGFRRGGANPGIPDELASRRSYTPDTSVNYELGLSSSFWGQRAQFNVALFYIDWTDVQLYTIEDAPIAGIKVGYITNANDAISQGVEIDFAYHINAEFSLVTNYSYTDAALAEDAINYSGADDSGYKNDRLPGSPRNQLFLALLYEKNVGAYTVDASVSGNYVSNVTSQLNPEHDNYEVLSSYSLLNLSAGIGQGQWRAGLFVNNIQNKHAVTGIDRDAYSDPAYSYDYVVRPRTIGVDLTYQF